MRGSRKFCQRRSNSDNVFFVAVVSFDEEREDPNTIMGKVIYDGVFNGGLTLPQISCYGPTEDGLYNLKML